MPTIDIFTFVYRSNQRTVDFCLEFPYQITAPSPSHPDVAGFQVLNRNAIDFVYFSLVIAVIFLAVGTQQYPSGAAPKSSY